MLTNYPGIKLEWAIWKWKIVGKCYVYLTAKQVISCRGYDEKGCEICKNEKCTCKACKTTDFCRRICKFVKFLSWILLNYQLSWLDRVEPAWWVKFEVFTWVAGVRGGGWHLYQGKLFSTKTGLDKNLKSVLSKQNCHLSGDFRLSLNLYCWTTLHSLCIKTEYFLSWAEITRNFKVFPLKNSRQKWVVYKLKGNPSNCLKLKWSQDELGSKDWFYESYFLTTQNQQFEYFWLL